VHAILRQIQDRSTQQLHHAAVLPQVPTFDFPAELPAQVRPDTVRQRCTRQRTIYSLEHGAFVAREMVMEPRKPWPGPQAPVWRSHALGQIVAPKCRYAFDLMVHVGLRTLLECERIEDVLTDLRNRPGLSELSEQAVWRLQQKFLVYMGVVHRAWLPAIGQEVQRRGGYVLMVDSTCEAGPPALLVALDPDSHIVLGSWKIASESKDAVRVCLRHIRQSLGAPRYILIDLSQALKQALLEVFPHVPHKRCHFHFLSDVGQDLCDPAQTQLRKALRAHKLQGALRNLRVHVRRRVLQARGEHPHAPTLGECLQHGATPPAQARLLQQQMLLSIHDWIQDYRHDGHREGYPFDPFVLYLHRRLAAANDALDHLIQTADKAGAKGNDLVALRNLRERLRGYLSDPEVMQAATEFEESYAYLQRLRRALRLPTPAHSCTPRSETHDLAPHQASHLEPSIQALVQALEQERSTASKNGQRGIQIILDHLEKYGDELRPFTPAAHEFAPRVHRTTNALEQFFRLLKRLRRRVHGRESLRPDLLHLPQELPLVLNLQNDTYLQITLGSLEGLPAACAQHAEQAQEILQQRRQQAGPMVGGVPRMLLRTEGYLDTLSEVVPMALAPGGRPRPTADPTRKTRTNA